MSRHEKQEPNAEELVFNSLYFWGRGYHGEPEKNITPTVRRFGNYGKDSSDHSRVGTAKKNEKNGVQDSKAGHSRTGSAAVDEKGKSLHEQAAHEHVGSAHSEIKPSAHVPYTALEQKGPRTTLHEGVGLAHNYVKSTLHANRYLIGAHGAVAVAKTYVEDRLMGESRGAALGDSLGAAGNVALDVAKNAIPFYASIQDWKAGHYGSAIGWGTFDAICVAFDAVTLGSGTAVTAPAAMAIKGAVRTGIKMGAETIGKTAVAQVAKEGVKSIAAKGAESFVFQKGGEIIYKGASATKNLALHGIERMGGVQGVGNKLMTGQMAYGVAAIGYEGYKLAGAFGLDVSDKVAVAKFAAKHGLKYSAEFAGAEIASGKAGAFNHVFSNAEKQLQNSVRNGGLHKIETRMAQLSPDWKAAQGFADKYVPADNPMRAQLTNYYADLKTDAAKMPIAAEDLTLAKGISAIGKHAPNASLFLGMKSGI